MEIIETGKLRRIQYERTEDVEVGRLFQGIYGVGKYDIYIRTLSVPVTRGEGQSTALKWYANGCRTLEDLASGKFGVKLTPAQEIGLRYYKGEVTSLQLAKLTQNVDINSRMPRSEAKMIFEMIKPIGLLPVPFTSFNLTFAHSSRHRSPAR